MITSHLSSIWKMRSLLNPTRHGFYAMQLLTHGVLERLLFFPLVLAFFTAPLLWNHGFIYQIITVGQLVFHSLAGTGYLLRDLRIGRMKVFRFPLSFDMLIYASAIAFLNLTTGTRYTVWKPQQTPTVKTTIDYVVKN